MPRDAVGYVTRIAALATLVAALVLFVARAGAPGWGGAADAAAAARSFGPGAPGATMLGALADLLPIGDAGFRVAILSALATVLALGGVLALAHALVPDEPIAGPVAVAIAAFSPAVGATAEVAGAGAIVAALLTWSAVHAVRAARGSGTAAPALGLAAAVIAVAPFTGVLAVVVIAAALVRTRARAIVLAAMVIAALPAWWLIARAADLAPWLTDGADLGRLGDLAATIGNGAGAPLLLAGLVGLGFAALTRLRGAALALGLVAAALVGAALDGGDPTVALLIAAAGLAPLAGAIARALAKEPTRMSRLAIGAAASAPIALLAALAPAGASLDPGDDTPATAVRAVLDAMPAGPGSVLLASPELYAAARAEQAIAGVRPDLAIAAGRDDEATSRFAVAELRAGHVVASDVDALGTLEPRYAIPRGRGFQLLGTAPPIRLDPPSPARWPGAIGAALADGLAMNRASYEAVSGHLDAAARAAGLVDAGRFDAPSLAMLATATPSADHPAVYAFVPSLGTPGWERDVFGDDLAWVAGLDVPAADSIATPERRLHALWCEILAGKRRADDPAIAAIGPAAVNATHGMLAALHRE